MRFKDVRDALESVERKEATARLIKLVSKTGGTLVVSTTTIARDVANELPFFATGSVTSLDAFVANPSAVCGPIFIDSSVVALILNTLSVKGEEEANLPIEESEELKELRHLLKTAKNELENVNKEIEEAHRDLELTRRSW